MKKLAFLGILALFGASTTAFASLGKTVDGYKIHVCDFKKIAEVELGEKLENSEYPYNFCSKQAVQQ